MRKEQVLSRMREECLIAVIRAKNPEQGEKIVEAVIAGGIHFIEITMTMDEGNPVEFISAMAEKYRNDDRIVIGAGSRDRKTGYFGRSELCGEPGTESGHH